MSGFDPWTLDERPIIGANLPQFPAIGEGVFLAMDGWSFERFERNGEMAPIPYLRLTKGESIIEAALREFAWVEYGRAE